jgi:hypothetical protein
VLLKTTDHSTALGCDVFKTSRLCINSSWHLIFTMDNIVCIMDSFRKVFYFIHYYISFLLFFVTLFARLFLSSFRYVQYFSSGVMIKMCDYKYISLIYQFMRTLCSVCYALFITYYNGTYLYVLRKYFILTLLYEYYLNYFMIVHHVYHH